MRAFILLLHHYVALLSYLLPRYEAEAEESERNRRKAKEASRKVIDLERRHAKALEDKEEEHAQAMLAAQAQFQRELAVVEGNASSDLKDMAGIDTVGDPNKLTGKGGSSSSTGAAIAE